MILPISLQFSEDFEQARNVLTAAMGVLWTSTFSRNPSALFDAGLGVRSTIVLGAANRADRAEIFTTRLLRWVEEARPLLFHLIEYAALPPLLKSGGWTRTGSHRIAKLWDDLVNTNEVLGKPPERGRRSDDSRRIKFKTTALYYISAFLLNPPSFDVDGTPIAQTDVGSMAPINGDSIEITWGIALGKIALLWWASIGDDFHITSTGLASTPISARQLTKHAAEMIEHLSSEVQATLSENVIYTKYAGKWMGNYDVKAVRHLTDEIDRLLLQELGLEEYWEDIQLEYDRFLKMTGERPGTTRSLPDFKGAL